MKNSSVKTGCLIWSGLQGPSLSWEEKKWMEAEHISGVILFQRNIQSLTQLYELCCEIKSLKPAPLLLIDREGGSVDRLRHLSEMPKWPSPEGLSKVCSLEEIKQTAFYMGEELRTFGFSLNFAPVWDYLSLKPPSKLFRGRVLGKLPSSLAKKAQAFAQGLKEAGLAVLAKHFPGHGGVLEDSHEVLPVDKRSLKELDLDLSVFQKAIELPVDVMMSAHVVYSSLDSQCPATLSEKILKNLLREKMNFRGLIVSDDLDMKALNQFSLKQKGIQFLRAGGDVALKCQFDTDLLSLPEQIREEISNNKDFEQVIDLKIKEVLSFKKKFQCRQIPPLIQWNKQIGKNSNSQTWCRKLCKRLSVS